MALSDLNTELRLEYHDRDETSPLLEDEQLERALRRAVVSINKDLKIRCSSKTFILQRLRDRVKVSRAQGSICILSLFYQDN